MLAVLSFASLGCQRSGEDRQEQDAGGDAEQSNANSSTADGGQAQARIAVGRPKDSLPSGEGAAAGPAAASSSASARTGRPGGALPHTLRAATTVPLMPEDFVIGPLQDSVRASADARGVTSIVLRFLRALATGDVDAALLDPAVRDDVLRSLAPELEAEALPTAVRLGAVNAVENAARVNVRLFGSGRVAGEIYLIRRAGGWWITDVQVDLAALRTPYQGRGKPFFPSSYRWLLIN